MIPNKNISNKEPTSFQIKETIPQQELKTDKSTEIFKSTQFDHSLQTSSEGQRNYLEAFTSGISSLASAIKTFAQRNFFRVHPEHLQTANKINSLEKELDKTFSEIKLQADRVTGAETILTKKTMPKGFVLNVIEKSKEETEKLLLKARKQLEELKKLEPEAKKISEAHISLSSFSSFPKALLEFENKIKYHELRQNLSDKLLTIQKSIKTYVESPNATFETMDKINQDVKQFASTLREEIKNNSLLQEKMSKSSDLKRKIDNNLPLTGKDLLMAIGIAAPGLMSQVKRLLDSKLKIEKNRELNLRNEIKNQLMPSLTAYNKVDQKLQIATKRYHSINEKTSTLKSVLYKVFFKKNKINRNYEQLLNEKKEKLEALSKYYPVFNSNEVEWFKKSIVLANRENKDFQKELKAVRDLTVIHARNQIENLHNKTSSISENTEDLKNQASELINDLAKRSYMRDKLPPNFENYPPLEKIKTLFPLMYKANEEKLSQLFLLSNPPAIERKKQFETFTLKEEKIPPQQNIQTLSKPQEHKIKEIRTQKKQMPSQVASPAQEITTSKERDDLVKTLKFLDEHPYQDLVENPQLQILEGAHIIIDNSPNEQLMKTLAKIEIPEKPLSSEEIKAKVKAHKKEIQREEKKFEAELLENQLVQTQKDLKSQEMKESSKYEKMIIEEPQEESKLEVKEEAKELTFAERLQQAKLKKTVVEEKKVKVETPKTGPLSMAEILGKRRIAIEGEDDDVNEDNDEFANTVSTSLPSSGSSNQTISTMEENTENAFVPPPPPPGSNTETSAPPVAPPFIEKKETLSVPPPPLAPEIKEAKTPKTERPKGALSLEESIKQGVRLKKTSPPVEKKEIETQGQEIEDRINERKKIIEEKQKIKDLNKDVNHPVSDTEWE